MPCGHGVSEIRQAEMRVAEPLVSELTSSEVEIAVESLKWYKSPGFDQIPVEFIQAGSNAFRS
jgi:hypothetical protein